MHDTPEEDADQPEEDAAADQQGQAQRDEDEVKRLGTRESFSKVPFANIDDGCLRLVTKRPTPKQNSKSLKRTRATRRNRRYMAISIVVGYGLMS